MRFTNEEKSVITGIYVFPSPTTDTLMVQITVDKMENCNVARMGQFGKFLSSIDEWGGHGSVSGVSVTWEVPITAYPLIAKTYIPRITSTCANIQVDTKAPKLYA